MHNPSMEKSMQERECGCILGAHKMKNEYWNKHLNSIDPRPIPRTKVIEKPIFYPVNAHSATEFRVTFGTTLMAAARVDKQ